MAESFNTQVQQKSHASEYNVVSIHKSSVWPLLAKKQGSAATYNRLKDLNSIIASTSGLIAGFTFLVTNTPIDWKFDGWIDKSTRSDLFGAFLVVGLVLSLVSTLLATAIYGFINLIGPNNEELFGWFIERNKYFVGMPTLLMNIAIVVMLIGSSIAVGGLYSTWVYVIYTVCSIGGFGFVGAFFLYNQSALGKEFNALLSGLPDYADNGAQNADN